MENQKVAAAPVTYSFLLPFEHWWVLSVPLCLWFFSDDLFQQGWNVVPHILNMFNCLQQWLFSWLCVSILLPFCDTLFIITSDKVKRKNSAALSSPAGEPVDSSLCSSASPPEPVACEVPCSRDCVLSDWTLWSTCSQTCSSKNVEGKQMRTRSILAYNAGEGEMTCLSAATCAQLIHFCCSTAWHSPLYFWSLLGVFKAQFFLICPSGFSLRFPNVSVFLIFFYFIFFVLFHHSHRDGGGLDHCHGG